MRHYYKVAFKETNKRSIAKAITFRVAVMLGDLVIIYAITRHIAVALSIIVISNISSTIIYYLHERAWNKTLWGEEPEKNVPA